jgi:hypothetical protein
MFINKDLFPQSEDYSLGLLKLISILKSLLCNGTIMINGTLFQLFQNLVLSFSRLFGV